MKLIAIANLRHTDSVRVHKAGCLDAEADMRLGDLVSDPEQEWYSKNEFGLDYWSDINAEKEEGSEPYVFEGIVFMPCTRGLSVYNRACRTVFLQAVIYEHISQEEAERRIKEAFETKEIVPTWDKLSIIRTRKNVEIDSQQDL